MAVYEHVDRSGGDLDELYRTLSTRLERLVRRDVRASDAVIEEACQCAWSRLVDHRDHVRREAVLSWLVKTAVHEAFKLIRLGGRYVSLEATLEQGGDQVIAGAAPTPEELLEQRERLAAIGKLPERQQRLLWLHALGLSYAEMAVHTGSSTRTVERQLLRAKRRIREASVNAGLVDHHRAERRGR